MILSVETPGKADAAGLAALPLGTGEEDAPAPTPLFDASGSEPVALSLGPPGAVAAAGSVPLALRTEERDGPASAPEVDASGLGVALSTSPDTIDSTGLADVLLGPGERGGLEPAPAVDAPCPRTGRRGGPVSGLAAGVAGFD